MACGHARRDFRQCRICRSEILLRSVEEKWAPVRLYLQPAKTVGWSFNQTETTVLTRIIYATLATLTVISNPAQSVKAAVIISDATRSYPSPQTDDLHDVTGHHRYYGRSA
jgi:hypothetical protein